MIVLIWLSVIYVCIFFSILFISNIKSIEISLKTSYAVISIFLLVIGIMAYCTVPVGPDDLSRHIELIDKMGQEGANWTWQHSQYRYEVIINTAFFIVSQLENYHILVTGVAVSTYLFVFCATFIYLRKEQEPVKQALYFLFVLFGIVFLRLTFTGLRYHLAISLYFLGMACEYKKKRLSIRALICYFCSILIHKTVLIFLLLRIASPIFQKLKVFYLIIPFWGIGSYVIGRILLSMPGAYFRQFGKTLISYLGYTNYDMRVYFIKIIVVLFLGYIIYKKHKERMKEKCSHYLWIVFLFTLGSIPIIVIFERMATFLVVISCPILLKKRSDKVKFKISKFGLISCICCLYAYQLIDAINNFSIIRLLYL